MEYLEPYIPRAPNQLRITAIGISVVAIALFRGLLRKKKSLAGKVVLITGASSGIGEALAHEFVKAKCKVIIAARNVDKLNRVKNELVEKYKVPADDIVPIYIDLADQAAIPEICMSMINQFGKVDILVNNAGILCLGNVLETDLETYKKMMEINYFGQVAVTKGVLPHMVEKGGGTIVAVSSLLGRVSVPKKSAYAASKHALQAFCDSVRHEHRKDNIDVLVVSPTFVATDIAKGTLTGAGTTTGERIPEIDSGMSSTTCARSIIKGLVNCDTDLLVAPFIERLFVYIRAVAPSVFNYVIGLANN